MTRARFAGTRSVPAPVAVLCAAALASACGEPPPRDPSTGGPAPSASAAADRAVPSGSIRRTALKAVLMEGIPAMLQRVDLEPEPVMEGNAFRGFRIHALVGDPAFWKGVDLKPGDVIRRVNGHGVEHPEDAVDIFKALETAPELDVEAARGGKVFHLRYPIVDDAPAAKRPSP